jgi:hypothetical protein
MSNYPKYLKDCEACKMPIIAKDASFDKQTRRFCSKSCKAKTENPLRVWKSESRAKIGARHTTHGLSNDILWRAWLEMVRRCENVNSTAYVNYGGRGIKVAKIWKNSFASFRKWALNNGYDYTYNKNCSEYGDKLTIERLDVNKDYKPSNCTWIKMRDQSKNRRPYSEWVFTKKK